MKIKLIAVGKTTEPWIQQGIDIYTKKLPHYCKFEFVVVQLPKKTASLPPQLLKKAEGDECLRHIDKTDFVLLLDEKGQAFGSVTFASQVQRLLNGSSTAICFIIGGAFGFDDTLYQRANQLLSLSSMTFTHQMVRLFFLEQLYRAFTIIRNEKYHNN